MSRSTSPSSTLNASPKEKSNDDIPAPVSPHSQHDRDDQVDDQDHYNHDQSLPLDEEAAQVLKEEKSGDPFLVGWEPGEKANPMNWSSTYKSFITFVLGMLALAASLGSSIISPAEREIAEYTGISNEVAVLLISMYIIGFAVGPLIWAPTSEVWGRRISMLPAMVALALFSIGTAVGKNAQTMIICRFFSGVFGSAPVSNVSAALGDIWPPKSRGVAMTFYAVAVVGGPTIGPVIGSALTVQIGFRWPSYILAIWVFTIFVFAFFCLPEVYSPVLLKKKAQRLRKETGDSRWHHPHEDVKLDAKSIVTKHLARPIVMLTTEPMVTAIAFYASFVYGLLYMTLEVFPIVFEQNRGWPLITSTLPFLALFVGVLFAVLINLANQPRYARAVAANNGRAVPEARLPPMFLGGVLFTIGMFWFGWTADPDIPWPSCVVAAGFIGAGFNIIFQQCINFLVDTYSLYAASAVSANTFLRSLIAGGLPLAARPMFNHLGVGPAMSILGGVAALALPVPLIFMRYGLKLRKMSKFAPVHED
ncbi:MFS general substrate transporter [Aureobasidium pullulans]|uniref:Cercosporin MFS transporter CTB4 n=1 Tax=Aureobasidium pullulans TaxID=5580 RepID=A0A4T0BHC2_AURPU|nr:MFS general substrate transporter [Aureobasidium pullulans]TIA33771.1 MFS general substrate transporter [Aureobasidium pullulans]